MSPLDLCIGLHQAQASLRLKLDDELGTLHGIGWDDFVLLAQLAAAPDGVQFGLRLGAPRALQHVMPQRHAQRTRQRPGQF